MAHQFTWTLLRKGDGPLMCKLRNFQDTPRSPCAFVHGFALTLRRKGLPSHVHFQTASAMVSFFECKLFLSCLCLRSSGLAPVTSTSIDSTAGKQRGSGVREPPCWRVFSARLEPFSGRDVTVIPCKSSSHASIFFPPGTNQGGPFTSVESMLGSLTQINMRFESSAVLSVHIP